jgi:hypothetical protein
MQPGEPPRAVDDAMDTVGDVIPAKAGIQTTFRD